MLFVVFGVLLLRFLCKSKCFQTFCFFANGARSRLVFSHRLSIIRSAFFPFETFFRPLSGPIVIHGRSLVWGRERQADIFAAPSLVGCRNT